MWPFPLLRNHPTDKAVDRACKHIAEKIERGEMKVMSFTLREAMGVTDKDQKVNVWIENRMYAFADCGRIGGFVWKEAMPSRATARRLWKAISSYGVEREINK